MRLPGRKLGLFWQSYLGVVEVEGVEVRRDPAGLDELPATQEVVAVRVHQHEGDLRGLVISNPHLNVSFKIKLICPYLFGVPRMPRVQQDELVHVDGAVAVHVRLQN